jgi:hypothetical protein
VAASALPLRTIRLVTGRTVVVASVRMNMIDNSFGEVLVWMEPFTLGELVDNIRDQLLCELRLGLSVAGIGGGGSVIGMGRARRVMRFEKVGLPY